MQGKRERKAAKSAKREDQKQKKGRHEKMDAAVFGERPSDNALPQARDEKQKLL